MLDRQDDLKMLTIIPQLRRLNLACSFVTVCPACFDDGEIGAAGRSVGCPVCYGVRSTAQRTGKKRGSCGETSYIHRLSQVSAAGEAAASYMIEIGGSALEVGAPRPFAVVIQTVKLTDKQR